MRILNKYYTNYHNSLRSKFQSTDEVKLTPSAILQHNYHNTHYPRLSPRHMITAVCKPPIENMQQV